MFRILFLQFIVLTFIYSSAFSFNKRKEKEISTAKKFELIADSLINKGEFKPALTNYRKAGIIFEKNKKWIDAIRNYRQTGWCLANLNSLDSAQYFVDCSYVLMTNKIETYNEREKFEESEINYIKANIFYEKGEYDSTLLFLDKSIEIIQKLNSENNLYNLTLAKYYQTYGTTYFKKGEYDLFLKYNFKALSLRQKELEVDHEEIIKSCYNIAIAYSYKRDYVNASQYFLDIVNNANKDNWSWIARSYNYLGAIYQQLEEYNKSVEYYTEALDLYEEFGDEYLLNIARVKNNLCKLHCLLGNYKEAYENIISSIEIRKACLGKSHAEVSKSLFTLADYYYQLNDHNKALTMSGEAIDILNNQESYGYNILKSQLYNLNGLIYLNKNENLEAVKSFHLAICELINGFEYYNVLNNPTLFIEGTNIINSEFEIISKPNLYDNLINKANAFYLSFEQDTSRKDYLLQSAKTYKLAFQLLDIFRLEISNDESKYFLGKNEKDKYNDAINVYIEINKLYPESGYNKYILELIDKSKSSSLRDKTYITNALIKSDIPEVLIKKEKELAKKLAFYKTQLNKNDVEVSLINDYKKEYYHISVEYDTTNNYLEENFPVFYNLTHYNELDIKKVQSAIEQNEIVLKYFIANDEIVIATITSDDYKIKVESIDESFKEIVLDYYKSIRKVDLLNFKSGNEILYNKLIKPIEDRINGKKRLLIIPDDYLYYVPFETLCDTKNSIDFDFTKNNYLIKNFDIRYNHSLNLWMLSKQRDKEQRSYIGDFIGFAPVFDESNSTADTKITTVDTLTRAMVVGGKKFSKLQYSEKEISEISKLFEKNNKNAVSFFHQNATEDNFKQNMNGYKYIHVSTHGYANEHNSDLSGLAFYYTPFNLDNSIEVKEDGLLFASEINCLETNAHLVVLSACETGMGKLVKGEGLIAINRGFIQSGVPNIVYTLWNVLDKSSSVLMIDFYKEILAGQNYAQAMRTVKLKMIQNPKTSYPKMWSSFVLMGI